MEFTCPKTLQAYNQFIRFVDLVGFDKNWWKIFSKGKFQKFYEQGFLGIGFHAGKQHCDMEYIDEA